MLKVYRSRLPGERVEELREIVKIIASDHIPENEYIYIGDWPVFFQTHLAPPGTGVKLFSSNSKGWGASAPENQKEILEYFHTEDKYKGLELFDQMIEKHPLNLWYQALKAEMYIKACIQWLKYSEELIAHINNFGPYCNSITILAHDVWSGVHLKVPKGEVNLEISIYLRRALDYLANSEEILTFANDVDSENKDVVAINEYLSSVKSSINYAAISEFFN